MDKVVFLNADGSKTMYYFGFPVKYRDDNGDIQDISLAIANSDTKSGEFETTANAAVTTFSAQFADGITLSADNADIRLAPVLASANAKASNSVYKAKRVDEKTIGYYYDSKTTVEYSLTYTGFKEDIVVSEYTGQTTYPFRLYTNGLALSESNGSYYLVDNSGEIQATIGDIIIFTADERNNGFGDIVATTVRENQEYLLTIVVEDEYLSDPKTVYPIRIDPTIELNYSNNGQSAIEDITITTKTNYSGTHGSLYVGRRSEDGIARILMRFPGLNLSSLQGATVTSASVNLRDLMCESTELKIYCYAFTGSVWDANSATWSSANPSFSTRFSSRAISYDIGETLDPVHWYAFDITDAVQGWIIGNYSPNKGLLFRASYEVENGDADNNRTFGSYNRSSYKPSLAVTYTTTSTQVLSNDTYYLNNKYSGKYMRYTSSEGATGASGLLSSLGSSIQWKVQQVSGGYVIRPTGYTTKYLGVPEDTTSNLVEIITISDAAIPASCIWTISTASEGYRIKNTYNDRYLYIYYSTPYTAQTAGSTGTANYYSRIWRMPATSTYGATSSTLYRELSASSKFEDLEIEVSGSVPLSIIKSSSKEIWCTASDFTFSATPAEKVSISSGVLTGLERGVVTVTATHNVTNRVKKFEVYIKNSLLDSTEHNLIREQFKEACETDYAYAMGYNLYTVEEAINLVLEYDTLITSHCNTHRIPKEFVQSVLFREIWCYNVADDPADLLVINYYAWKNGDLIDPPEIKTDSSTGLGQIFAATAINALNNANDRGFISLTSKYDKTNWHHMWSVWNRLRTDNNFNIACCTLVILDCQYEYEESMPLPYEDFFDYTEDQIKRILSRYNGTNEQATNYGDICYDYYQIFATYNQ